MRSVIEKWKDRLGLHLWSIGTQEIISEQVVYPDDCTGDERFFIGVEKDHNRFEATIYHDVPLYGRQSYTSYCTSGIPISQRIG